MSETLVAVWGDRFVDNRHAGGEPESFEGWEQIGDYEPGRRVKAILGWKGFFPSRS